MAYELQRNFSSGEISPKMLLRNDLGPSYFNSVERMRNMVPESWGPSSSRRGFSYVDNFAEEKAVKIVPFKVDLDENYIIAIDSNVIRLYHRTGRLRTQQLVRNPYFSDGPTNWTQRNTVNFGGGICNLSSFDDNVGSIRQRLTLNSGTSYRMEVHRLAAGPVIVKIGSQEGGTNLFLGEFKESSPIILDWEQLGPIAWIEVSPKNRLSGGVPIAVDAIKVYEQANAESYYEFVSPWTAEQVPLIQYEQSPNGKEIYFVQEDVRPQKLVFDKSVQPPNSWTFIPVDIQYPDIIPPWGDTEHPRTLAFHEGRLYFGGSPSNPNTIWSSRVNSFEDFTYQDDEDPPLATPGDPLTLPITRAGRIQWMLSNDVLYVGMDSGEHALYGMRGPLDVDDAQVKQQSAYGSAPIQAKVVNEQVCYVDTSGRIVRSLDFDWRSQKYISNRMTYIAEHITLGVVRSMDCGSSPATSVWFTTSDGDLVTCHVERDTNTLGWARHHTEGEFVSIALLRERGQDVPWVIVRRFNRLFLERYNLRQPVFLDSAVQQIEEERTDTFANLDHLNNRTVAVLADNAVHPDVRVQNGEVKLNYPARLCTVGFRFNREIVTHPKVDERQTGNTFIHKKRWVEAVIAIQGSVRPTVNGIETFRRRPATPMDRREPNASEYVYTTQLGHTPEGRIYIESDDPFDMVITGIGGKLSEETL